MTDQNQRDEANPGEVPSGETAQDASPLEGPSPEDLASANAVPEDEAAVEPGKPTPGEAAGAAPVAGTAAAGTPATAGTPARATSSKGPRARDTASGAAPTAVVETAEPHYIDDPVSRWWVILIVAVFVVIFAWALLLGSNGLLSGGEPAATVSPTPSASATQPASPTATTAATAEASLAPSAEPASPSATSAPTATPTATPTTTPSAAATAEATAAPTPLPSAEAPSLPPASPAG